MEGKQLEKKLRDWASDLSFTLPNGSNPPTNYFALLTSTPHRRQLWETLIESVQPRQKVEHLRKQIMVAKLKGKRKHFRKCDSKPETDRIELWHKQGMLENQIDEKRNEVIKLERIIIAKMSDVLFEVCKLAELEKVYEESSQKALILRLFMMRERNALKKLEKIMLKEREILSCSEYFERNNYSMKDELFGEEECKSVSEDSNDSKLGSGLKKLCKSGIPQQNMWEQMVKCKNNLLNKFAAVLEELKLNEKSALSEKEAEMEESLNASIRQLKRKETEKSLQVILNSKARETLNWEMGKLEERFYKGEFNGTLAKAVGTVGTRDRLSCDGRAEKIVEKCASAAGLRCYREFLGEEAKRLGEEVAKAGGKESWKTAEGEVERGVGAAASYDLIVDKMSSERSKKEEISEILESHHKLMSRMQSLGEEAEEKQKMRAFQDAEKLECAYGKLIDIFMETPLDAFRIVESRSGRLSFECESLSHCLNSYGGELNHFFSAILIPPQPDSQSILSEVEARTKMLTQVRNIIRRRDDLAQSLRRVQQQIDSMALDTQSCEGNFQESADILSNALSKTDDLLRETDFIESVLRNWVEQPYRWMGRQT